MDVSDEDSLFDFFADVPGAKSHVIEKSSTQSEPLNTPPLSGCETWGSQIRNVTVKNERQIQTHNIFSQDQDIYSDEVSTAASLHSPSLEVGETSVPEYEDDFESTPSETSESYPTVSCREDSRVQSGSTTDSSAVVSCSTRRHPTQMSPGHSQHKAARNICNGDRYTRGFYHVTEPGVHKGKQSAERKTTDRRLLGSGGRVSGRKAGYKDINKRFDGKNTIHLASSRSRKQGGYQHTSSSGTNSGSGRVKRAVDSELSLDTSSDVPVGSYVDIHLNNFSKKSVKMASRNKLSLPRVDRSGRVQLTRHRGDRTTGHQAKQSKISSKQPRTYVSMTGKDNVRSGSNRRQSRKPAVPIPLKSEAIYCDGELSVNVSGDRRGNPDRNKFNVTITVVHKHTKSRPTPYLNRQTRRPRGLPQSRPIDWDIVQHRAVFPGFNTSTDPEVNRRFLQQFGL